MLVNKENGYVITEHETFCNDEGRVFVFLHKVNEKDDLGNMILAYSEMAEREKSPFPKIMDEKFAYVFLKIQTKTLYYKNLSSCAHQIVGLPASAPTTNEVRRVRTHQFYYCHLVGAQCAPYALLIRVDHLPRQSCFWRER